MQKRHSTAPTTLQQVSVFHEDGLETRVRADVRLHAGADLGHSDRCSPLAEGAVDYVSLVGEVMKGRDSGRVGDLIDRRSVVVGLELQIGSVGVALD